MQGKMVEFADYEMPVEYSGIKDEHMTVRNAAGVFDVSTWESFGLKVRALDLLRKISSNDPSVLQSGQVQYTCFPNGQGGIGMICWFTVLIPKNIYWWLMPPTPTRTGNGSKFRMNLMLL